MGGIIIMSFIFGFVSGALLTTYYYDKGDE